ncbi:MAG: subclass B1 metallo-beta-lactamase [Spirochaetaceae bacterium]
MSRVNKIGLICLLNIIVISDAYSENNQTIHISSEVKLNSISDNVWIYISDIKLEKWGKVSANGMAIITNNQLVLIDTPWNDEQTKLLILWFTNNYDITEIKVIVSHYHVDNLGGLNWIHQNGIESYSIGKTQEICKNKNLSIPINTLSNPYIFDFSDTIIEVHFLGEGHTVDSASVYLPNEKILFAGCSVKSLKNSTLGNVADANLKNWPVTLQNMMSSFPDAKIIIPGHGLEGSMSLIDHTLSLFN